MSLIFWYNPGFREKKYNTVILENKIKYDEIFYYLDQQLHNILTQCTMNVTYIKMVNIFIITNTMHTIGVDKITLFKTT